MNWFEHEIITVLITCNARIIQSGLTFDVRMVAHFAKIPHLFRPIQFSAGALNHLKFTLYKVQHTEHMTQYLLKNLLKKCFAEKKFRRRKRFFFCGKDVFIKRMIAKHHWKKDDENKKQEHEFKIRRCFAVPSRPFHEYYRDAKSPFNMHVYVLGKN